MIIVRTHNEIIYRDYAKKALMEIFESNPDKVFYTNQLAVMNERQFYHWITSHALSDLYKERKIVSFQEEIEGQTYTFFCNKKVRYYKTALKELSSSIKILHNHRVSHLIGKHLERLVTTSFFKLGFSCHGIAVNEFNGKQWNQSNHNLDLIVEKDNIVYGVECKNTIPYINKKEFDIKIKMCKFLGIRPLFAVRYLPSAWVKELYENNGFAWLFEYQLYPQYLIENLQQIGENLRLPLKVCEELWQSTNDRFLKNHNRIFKA